MLALVAVVLSVSGPWTCDREDARVARHLEDALIQLRTVAPPGLSEVQRARRAEVLGLLRHYIDERQFPRSSGPTGPVFVDDDGRHCAMGALISWTGGAEMVEHIRATRNLATVPTLADEPGLVDWLTAHGLAPEEAALVQPTYYFCAPAIALCPDGAMRHWEMISGGALPDGRMVPPRYAESSPADGRCEGEPPGRWSWLDLYGLPGNVRYVDFFARTSTGLTPVPWASCRDPLSFDSMLLEVAERRECMRRMVAQDERALLMTCASYGDTQLCDELGRFRERQLPPFGSQRAQLEDWFSSQGIDPADAGLPIELIDGLELGTWRHVDDGGTTPAGPFADLVLWTGHLDMECMAAKDAGLPGPQVPDDASVGAPAAALGCSSAPGLFLCGAVLLAVLRRGRRRAQSAR